MSVPESLRVYITKGNVVPLYVTLYNDLSVYDLTAATVWFTVKRYVTDSDETALIRKKWPATLAIPDAVSGMIKININNSDTTNITNSWFSYYPFDIQVKDSIGNIITTTYGSLGVYPGITVAKS